MPSPSGGKTEIGAWFVSYAIWVNGFVYVLFQSEERGGSRNRGPSRRSKSEGPPGESSEFPGPILSEYHKRYRTGLSPGTHGWVMRRDSDPSKLDQDLLVGLPALQRKILVLSNKLL